MFPNILQWVPEIWLILSIQLIIQHRLPWGRSDVCFLSSSYASRFNDIVNKWLKLLGFVKQSSRNFRKPHLDLPMYLLYVYISNMIMLSWSPYQKCRIPQTVRVQHMFPRFPSFRTIIIICPSKDIVMITRALCLNSTFPRSNLVDMYLIHSSYVTLSQEILAAPPVLVLD